MDTKLPFDPKTLHGISEKTILIHADKLYQGYVKKTKEIGEQLNTLVEQDLTNANPHYSRVRELKAEETWATNGVYLHEFYFASLGASGEPTGSLVEVLKGQFGSWQRFVDVFSACGLSARGWVILSWDTRIGALKIYTADAHNQGGVWGALPLLVLDVYEHAYFIDYGADRKAYIADWWKNQNWEIPNQLFEQVKSVKIDLPV